jgi:hypothetical protein
MRCVEGVSYPVFQAEIMEHAGQPLIAPPAGMQVILRVTPSGKRPGLTLAAPQ